eukprot:gene25214-30776_t
MGHSATDEFCRENCNQEVGAEPYTEYRVVDIGNTEKAEQTFAMLGNFAMPMRKMERNFAFFFLYCVIDVHNALTTRRLEGKRMMPIPDSETLAKAIGTPFTSHAGPIPNDDANVDGEIDVESVERPRREFVEVTPFGNLDTENEEAYMEVESCEQLSMVPLSPRADEHGGKHARMDPARMDPAADLNEEAILFVEAYGAPRCSVHGVGGDATGKCSVCDRANMLAGHWGEMAICGSDIDRFYPRTSARAYLSDTLINVYAKKMIEEATMAYCNMKSVAIKCEAFTLIVPFTEMPLVNWIGKTARVTKTLSEGVVVEEEETMK